MDRPSEDPLELVDTTAAVDTPERVRFRYRLAGPARRGAAWGIDFGLRLTLLAGLAVVIGGLALLVSPILSLPSVSGMGTGAMFLVMFLMEWGYGAFFETVMSGRTPGKLVLRLRVVREDGAPAAFPDFLLRNLLRTADFLPGFFAAGLFSMFLDRKLRRIGDLVAGTVVVVERRGQVLDNLVIEPPVSDEERQALPSRVVLSRAEIAVIESFLRRRKALSADRAEELARQLGPRLSDRTGVEADTWERVLVLAYARATGKER